jgi:hypothetical protein
MAKTAVKQHGSLYKFSLTGVVFVILITLIVINAASIKRQMNEWKLLPQPERLTELYFTHPNSLPGTYTAGQTLPVDFTVHNIEYKTENYKYQIIEDANNSTKGLLLASGSFTLKQNQYKFPALSVTPANLGPKVQIIVNLSNVNELVDYWVNGSGS